MSSEDLAREAQDPATPAARLQEIAQLDRSTWADIAANPSAYDGLLDWLAEHGDATVRAAVASRATATPAVEVTQELTPAEPTTQLPVTPAATQAAEAPVAETTSFGSVPPGGAVPVAEATGSSKKNLLILAGIAAAVVVLVGGIAFAATSGDDDTSDKTTSAAPEKTGAVPDAPGASDTPGGDETDPPKAPAGESGDFCSAMKGIQDTSLASLPSGGGAPDLGDIQDSFREMQDAYDDLEKSAPSALKKDVAVMGSFIDSVLKASSGDSTGLNANTEEYSAAVQRVATYYATNCG